MELKWTKKYYQAKENIVLIVPLWNWNKCASTCSSKDQSVLIVPLWNWNTGGVAGDFVVIDGFNRTFMELK